MTMLETLGIICIYITVLVLFFGALFVLIDWVYGIDKFCGKVDQFVNWIESLFC